ncbi:MAG: CBS domain-containing protein [Gammaproteobacteria bacterium]|nr:CBS domain-containing protein [Gammaproteobacteria bacterium]
MHVRDVITRSLKTIDSTASLRQAATMMRELDVGVLPVSERDEVVGMITDRDITIRGTATGAAPDDTPVSRIYSPGVVFARENDDIAEAAEIMEESQVRRLLVVDHDDRCVGIVSLGDLALRAGDDGLGGEILQQVSKPPR